MVMLATFSVLGFPTPTNSSAKSTLRMIARGDAKHARSMVQCQLNRRFGELPDSLLATLDSLS